jgi:hypothetical protein
VRACVRVFFCWGGGGGGGMHNALGTSVLQNVKP